MSMHEQQESVSGDVSHCLCRLPSDNMTSLKFIRVLEIQEHITKNHLLRTCSLYLIFWSKMLPVPVNGRVQKKKRAGNRPRSIYMSNLRRNLIGNRPISDFNGKTSLYQNNYNCIAVLFAFSNS